MHTYFKQQQKIVGGAGYRSPYLSHAKRALYHLSYTPCLVEVLSIGNKIKLFVNVTRFALNCSCSQLIFISPSIAQLVERWTVVVRVTVIHRSLVQIRFEGVIFVLMLNFGFLFQKDI
jgi:hypothetical protein